MFFRSKMIFKLSNVLNSMDNFEEEVLYRDILNAKVDENGGVCIKLYSQTRYGKLVQVA